VDAQPEKEVHSEKSGKSDKLRATEEPHGIVDPKSNTLTGKHKRESKTVQEGLDFIGKKGLPAYGKGKCKFQKSSIQN